MVISKKNTIDIYGKMWKHCSLLQRKTAKLILDVQSLLEPSLKVCERSILQNFAGFIFTLHCTNSFIFAILTTRKHLQFLNHVKLYTAPHFTRISVLKYLLTAHKCNLFYGLCVCTGELSPVHTHNHTITVTALLHQHACALCALFDVDH